MPPRALDLFCGAGGAAMGLHRAGYEVVGVDIKPQPRYPFEFHQGDAMEWPLDGFDLIWASPPCQLYTRAKHLREAQGFSCTSDDLLEATRHRLEQSGGPWILENVEGAKMSGITLCGSMFGLRVRRHRIFETRPFLLAPCCNHAAQGKPIGVYHRLGDSIPNGGTTARTLEEAQDAMGIDWMEWDELKGAIPPAYSEWLGRRILEADGAA